MQTSLVFDQRTYPGIAGDIDDCWVVASLQALHAAAPWLHLPSVRRFRRAAGVPDGPGPDGGQLADILRGMAGLWPEYRALMTPARGWSFGRLMAAIDDGHPASVAIDSAELPAVLQFGYTGLHQVCLARPRATGPLLYANPLAAAQSRWLRIEPADVRRAVIAYGARRAARGAWAVLMPTDAESAALWSSGIDTTPYDQDDLDAATAELQARIDAAREALDPDTPIP